MLGVARAALVCLALSLGPARAWADMCFGSGSNNRDDRDAGVKIDGAAVGQRGSPAGPRRLAGGGLVFLAGAGSVWLVARRQRPLGGR